MARRLILASSSPGDTIFDPFVGSGVVALESLISNRCIVCCDTNPYGVVLTRAKLFPPPDVDSALTLAEHYIEMSLDEIGMVELNEVPIWVQSFFHKKTLIELVALVRILRRYNQDFILACLLGIMHHQRPGFLSYPASHAIPYLRTKKFPKDEFPQLYEYRAIKPRLQQKIKRAYRRFPQINESLSRNCYLHDVTKLRLPKESIDAVVTSPPYMNTLDYVRDNRLRLWFLGFGDAVDICKNKSMTLDKFENLMRSCLEVINIALRPQGKCFFVTGEVASGKNPVNTANVITQIAEEMGNYKCEYIIEDCVPEERRIRKTGRRVKREFVVVLRKETRI
jgi:hypothetical protein